MLFSPLLKTGWLPTKSWESGHVPWLTYLLSSCISYFVLLWQTHTRSNIKEREFVLTSSFRGRDPWLLGPAFARSIKVAGMCWGGGLLFDFCLKRECSEKKSLLCTKWDSCVPYSKATGTSQERDRKTVGGKEWEAMMWKAVCWTGLAYLLHSRPDRNFDDLNNMGPISMPS